MKKYLVMLLAIAILSGCRGRNNSKNESEETSVEVKTTTIEGTRVFSLPDAENSYMTCKYSIVWPEEINGIDADKFKTFVLENVLDTTGTDIKSLIEANCEKFASELDGVATTDVTYEQVAEMRENNGAMQSYPSYEISNKILAYDPVHNIIEMLVTAIIDYDTGTGAGFNYYEANVYYDCRRNCKVELSDIVSDKDKVLSVVKKMVVDRADELCADEDAVNNLAELPSRFTISDFGLYFIFEKYEIACGAAGNPKIWVPFGEVMDVLTPMGKKLFVSETAYEEVKNEANTITSELISSCLDYGQQGPDVDKMEEYFTKEYNETEAKCNSYGGEMGWMGWMGWIDYDPWIDAQDYEDVSFTIKNVFTVSESKAIVELELKNFGMVQTKYLLWKRQDGKLKLDDYTTSGNSIRTMMEDYLSYQFQDKSM